MDASLGVTWKKIALDFPGEEHSDLAKNVSSLGICLIIYEKLEPGDRLSLTIELPNKRVIPTTGRVVWSRAFSVPGQNIPINFDVGIEFLDIKAEDRRMLKQFVLFPKGSI